MGKQWKEEEDKVVIEERTKGGAWIARAYRRLNNRSKGAISVRSSALKFREQEKQPQPQSTSWRIFLNDNDRIVVDANTCQEAVGFIHPDIVKDINCVSRIA